MGPSAEPRLRQDRPSVDPSLRDGTEPAAPPLSAGRLVLGALLVAGGAIALLRVLGVLEEGFVAGWWSAGVAALGLVQLAVGDNRYAKALGLVLLLFGGALTAAKWYPQMLQPERVWDVVVPVAALGLGGYVVLRTLVPGRASEAGDRVSVFSVMAGVERSVDSTRFEGGDLTAIMGGWEVDLRNADIGETGEAVIDVLAVMGGGVLHVPEDWAVDAHVIPLMGGVSVKTKSPGPAPRGVLRVRGIALMGGLEIKN
jgi:hypothetical protein